MPPQGSKTKQGYELQLGTNNLGHFLFVKYLHDILKKTAVTAPKGSVRVIWVSSSAILMAPSPPIDFDNMDYHKDESAMKKYSRSKAGNVLHCAEYANRTAGDGVLSLVSHCFSVAEMPLYKEHRASRFPVVCYNLLTRAMSTVFEPRQFEEWTAETYV